MDHSYAREGSQIQYILENPVADLELAFTNEVGNGTPVELRPNGARQPVTDDNKVGP